MENQKPLGERITQGEWVVTLFVKGSDDYLKVLSRVDNKPKESICNITTRNQERAMGNSEFIAIAGNLAQKYPDVHLWESILEKHYADQNK